MAHNVVVSFERDQVKIIHTEAAGSSLTLTKSLTIPLSDFSAYLKRETASSFIVTAAFSDAYQFTLQHPVLKPAFMQKIMEAEIRKRFPDLKEFAFFSISIGELVQDNKKMLESFIYAVGVEELSRITMPFAENNKTITALVPDFLPISYLLPVAAERQDETVLMIASVADERILLLLKQQALVFVRRVTALSAEYSSIDIQNINMTVNYCRQAMRLNPARAVFVGAAPEAALSAELILPAETGTITPDRFAGMQSDSIGPIAASLYGARCKPFSLLPPEYRDYLSQRRILQLIAIACGVISCLALAFIVWRGIEFVSLKNRCEHLRAGLSRGEASFRAYQQERTAFQPYRPVVDFLNAAHSAPNPSIPLARLAAFSHQDFERVRIHTATAKFEANALSILLKGSIADNEFAAMQKHFLHLKQAIQGIQGAQITNEKIELKSRSFELAVTFQRQEQ